MRASFITLAMALALGLGACVASGKGGRTLSASSVPDSLNLCADYGAKKGCLGRQYITTASDGRRVTSHEGMDFRAPPGTPVIAATSGTVSGAGAVDCGGGYVMTIADTIVPNPADGEDAYLYVGYHHIDPKVFSGYVTAGQVIGEIAPLGRYRDRCSDFAHVHFSTRINGPESRRHVSPNHYWLNGPGQVTCWREGIEVAPGKLVAPLRC